LALVLLGTLILVPGVYAKKKDTGNNGRGHGNKKEYREEQYEGYGFRSEHRQIIYDYYDGGRQGLPPGLAKRGGDLPPGLAKQLRRNGQLPPGLEKRMVPFPVELERRLPPLPPHYRRCFIGDRAIVYDDRTRGIIDSLTVVINIGR
ncbi:MAG TPA: hypothetical protein VHA11_01590, partial [Bryobacteraceae bacterium]|nr:hypothetical protein [Bryobacteraceae bacterium]